MRQPVVATSPSYESLGERTVLIEDENRMVYDQAMFAGGDDTSTVDRLASTSTKISRF